MFKDFKSTVWLAAATAAVLLTACASAPPQPPASVAKTPGSSSTPRSSTAAIVRAPDTVTINVDTAAGITMPESEKARFTTEITQQLAEKQAKVTAQGAAHQYSLQVTITRYTPGNAIALALSHGVGQIHVEGDIKLYQLPLRDPLKQFSVSKTFAWGGIYGPSPSMNDIESSFAQGVSSSLTGST